MSKKKIKVDTKVHIYHKTKVERIMTIDISTLLLLFVAQCTYITVLIPKNSSLKKLTMQKSLNYNSQMRKKTCGI